MNGRIYDPLLGRMLSADPVIQFPTNLQSYNRYSYVQNNPLTFTDPSGHFLALPAVWIILEALSADAVGNVVAAGAGAATGAVITHVLQNAPPGSAAQRDPYAAFGQQFQQAMRDANAKPAEAAANQVTAKADQQSNAPKPEASKNAPKENTSGGQMDPKNAPKGDQDPRKDQVKQNSDDGARRQKQVQSELEKENPGKPVQQEQYLRDKDGKIVRDPKTGEARRVDHVVIDRDAKTAKTVETTSLTANKTGQSEKEQRIRDEGGTHIRDRETREIVPVPDPSEIRRRQ